MAKTIKINESFICQNCGEEVPTLERSCRNHCCFCLWSLHVDGKTPGDRSSKCHGLMEPTTISKTGKGYMILHRCTSCKEVKNNRTAFDDNWDKIIELSQPC